MKCYLKITDRDPLTNIPNNNSVFPCKCITGNGLFLMPFFSKDFLNDLHSCHSLSPLMMRCVTSARCGPQMTCTPAGSVPESFTTGACERWAIWARRICRRWGTLHTPPQAGAATTVWVCMRVCVLHYHLLVLCVRLIHHWVKTGGSISI